MRQETREGPHFTVLGPKPFIWLVGNLDSVFGPTRLILAVLKQMVISRLYQQISSRTLSCDSKVDRDQEFSMASHVAKNMEHQMEMGGRSLVDPKACFRFFSLGDMFY